VLHTTIIGSDGIAVISSRNWNLRSLELDLWVRLVCYNSRVQHDTLRRIPDL
jgi:hypothetical protein